MTAQSSSSDIFLLSKALLEFDSFTDSLERHFSPEEMATNSLACLYVSTCTFFNIRPNYFILSQLPKVIDQTSYQLVTVLDARKTYLGNKGVAALIPVIEVCTSLFSLFLPGVGLKENVAKKLIRILSVHPGIAEIDLRNNDLGSCVGLHLKDMVLKNPNIRSIELDRTLIIPSIQSKILRHLQVSATKNRSNSPKYFMVEAASAPLVASSSMLEDTSLPVTPIFNEKHLKIAESDNINSSQEPDDDSSEFPQIDYIKEWEGTALNELVCVLRRNKRNMLYVYEMFGSVIFSIRPGDASLALMSSCAPPLWCLPAGLAKVMQNLGVTSLSSKFSRCEQIARLLGSWNSQTGLICYSKILFLLRTHALFLSDHTNGLEPSALDSSIKNNDEIVCNSSKSLLWHPFPLLYHSSITLQCIVDAIFDCKELIVHRLQSVIIKNIHCVSCGKFFSILMDLFVNPIVSKKNLPIRFGKNIVSSDEGSETGTDFYYEVAKGITELLRRQGVNDDDDPINYDVFFMNFVISPDVNQMDTNEKEKKRQSLLWHAARKDYIQRMVAYVEPNLLEEKWV